MRLIDWDKVLEWMHRQKETTEQWSMRIAIENHVDDMPTIDAVPVIRCKDCKWNKSDKWVDCHMTEMFGRTTDNYCSLAQRKEE